MQKRLALLISVPLLVAASTVVLRPYTWRNGAKEAQADISSMKSATLYTRTFNGVAMGFETPGVLDCDPYRSRSNSWHHFVIIPELAFYDGESPSLWQSFRASGARQFAMSYNHEIIRERGADVRRFCPNVNTVGS